MNLLVGYTCTYLQVYPKKHILNQFYENQFIGVNMGTGLFIGIIVGLLNNVAPKWNLEAFGGGLVVFCLVIMFTTFNREDYEIIPWSNMAAGTGTLCLILVAYIYIAWRDRGIILPLQTLFFNIDSSFGYFPN